MNRNHNNNQKIRILPCAGKSKVGLLTLRAAQELILEGRGEWVTSRQIADFQLHGITATDSSPFIVVDGCEKQCGRKHLETLECDFEFHLSLSDLGIEETEDDEIDGDALQLAKDGIISESTRLSEHPPMIPGGCCCK